MTAAVLEVRRAGPLVSYQDGGRPGLLRIGVPASGPMDPFAHAAANVALGRPAGATALEISLAGVHLACSAGPLTVAICGGEFRVRHNGILEPSWAVVTLRPGDELTIGAGAWGSWCYLAVAGTLRAARWLGSTSTHVRAGVGGGLVASGHELVIDDPVVDQAHEGAIEIPARARPPAEVSVVLGPQLGCFAPDSAAALVSAPYRLTSAYDRMGVRLQGPELELVDVLSIASTPIVRGSLQVAGDGAPTLLLADHQTTGGYPKIATALSDDTTRASQLRSGDTIRFRAVEPEAAVRAARAAAADRSGQLTRIAQRPGVRTRRLLATNLIDGVYHPPT